MVQQALGNGKAAKGLCVNSIPLEKGFSEEAERKEEDEEEKGEEKTTCTHTHTYPHTHTHTHTSSCVLRLLLPRRLLRCV